MPMIRSEYHPKWELISYLIRVVRAKNCCEQCGVRNHAFVRRLNNSAYEYATGCDRLQIAYVKTFKRANGRYFTTWQALRYLGLTKVILTVAHMDRDSSNNRFWNLKALCQRCHLLYDMPQHMRNRAYGRYHDREPQQVLPFFNQINSLSEK